MENHKGIVNFKPDKNKIDIAKNEKYIKYK